MAMKRVLVFGGRKYGTASRAEMREVFTALDRAAHSGVGSILVIEGGATGADSLAWMWAMITGCDVKTYEAEWGNIDRPGAVVKMSPSGRRYDAAAGGIRNQRMIDEGKPDEAIGFPGGTGTADMLRRLIAAGIPVRTIS